MPWGEERGCCVSDQKAPTRSACVLSIQCQVSSGEGTFSSLLPPSVHRMKPTFPQIKGKRMVEKMKTLPNVLSCERSQPKPVATLLSLLHYLWVPE